MTILPVLHRFVTFVKNRHFRPARAGSPGPIPPAKRRIPGYYTREMGRELPQKWILSVIAQGFVTKLIKVAKVMILVSRARRTP